MAVETIPVDRLVTMTVKNVADGVSVVGEVTVDTAVIVAVAVTPLENTGLVVVEVVRAVGVITPLKVSCTVVERVNCVVKEYDLLCPSKFVNSWDSVVMVVTCTVKPVAVETVVGFGVIVTVGVQLNVLEYGTTGKTGVTILMVAVS